MILLVITNLVLLQIISQLLYDLAILSSSFFTLSCKKRISDIYIVNCHSVINHPLTIKLNIVKILVIIWLNQKWKIHLFIRRSLFLALLGL